MIQSKCYKQDSIFYWHINSIDSQFLTESSQSAYLLDITTMTIFSVFSPT